MSAQQYKICFINQSGYAGNVCVYQDNSNVTFNLGAPLVLAWMVTGANPSVQINFQWQTDYNFVWFDFSTPQSQQITAADTSTANVVPLSWNQFGYYFQSVQASSPGQLSIALDASIPTVNSAIAGIGMHGAGTFASNARANTRLRFTPAADSQLVYWIGFGAPFVLNEPIDLPSLPIKSQQIIFPPGVYVMTAVLTSQNLWQTYPGPPVAKDALKENTVMIYEPGRGLVASP